MLRNIENFPGSVVTIEGQAGHTYAAGAKRPADVLTPIQSHFPQFGAVSVAGFPQMISHSNLPVVPQQFTAPAVASTSDIENAPKKMRMENQYAPSKVLLISNLPEGTLEQELTQLLLPFGKAIKSLFMVHRKQAFVEMGELSQAEGVMNCVSNASFLPTIRGRNVDIQFSHSYKNLESTRNEDEPIKPSPVLHIFMDHLSGPINVEVLHKIFTAHGAVLKIVIFNKNNNYQALLQYDQESSAKESKTCLDGRSLYIDGGNLRISYSKLRSLNVRYNNDKSRDYTNPNLPYSEKCSSLPIALSLPYPPAVHIPHTQPPTPQSLYNPYLALQNLQTFPIPHPAYSFVQQMASFKPEAVQPKISDPQLSLASIQPYSAAQPSYPFAYPQLTTVGMTQLPDPTQALPAIQAEPQRSQSTIMQSLGTEQQTVKHEPFDVAQAVSMAQYSAATQYQYPMMSSPSICLTGTAATAQSPVVLVTQLHTEKATTDALFTLFGVYGDILRVKICYNRRDTALIQFTDPYYAQLAIKNVDKLILWGKEIRVLPSHHKSISAGSAGDKGILTKDYTDSKLHRYKKKSASTVYNIYPPGPTLHLSNLPPGPPESYDSLRTEFAKYGEIKQWRIFETERRMGLVEMESLEQAIDALIGMNDFVMDERHRLRVSFSKPPQLNKPPASAFSSY